MFKLEVFVDLTQRAVCLWIIAVLADEPPRSSFVTFLLLSKKVAPFQTKLSHTYQHGHILNFIHHQAKSFSIEILDHPKSTALLVKRGHG